MKSFIWLLSILISIQAVGQSLQSTNQYTKDLDKDAKRAWHNLDYKSYKVYGTGTYKAESELLNNQNAKKKIVVAVIDSGVDWEHEDLQGHIWVNKGEVPDNGKDDDQNGFVDDVHGWNFLVDENGDDIIYENLEAVRMINLYNEHKKTNSIPAWMDDAFIANANKIYDENYKQYEDMSQFAHVYDNLDSMLVIEFKKSDYTIEEVKALETEDEALLKAKRFLTLTDKFGIKKADLDEMRTQSNTFSQYYLNSKYQPRPNLAPESDQFGNNHYGDEHSEHGTHVAGIIAADRADDRGAFGVAAGHAEIMILRAVPDGDERDLDVARSIRYAVDNGANIINMSFGKGLSPRSSMVQEAIVYASEHNVLLVHAAGNDSEDNDAVENYPNIKGYDKETLSFLTIGAIAPQKNKKLLASFTNYGDESVDLFSPGEDIYSTLPGNEYGYRSGTSMAAPVAAGVAALVWAYYPDLTALELKQLLIDTSIDLNKKKVVIPGTKKDKARLAELSINGSVISAYQAIASMSNASNIATE